MKTEKTTKTTECERCGKVYDDRDMFVVHCAFLCRNCVKELGYSKSDFVVD
jgi:late competence protein required for DNA uptake (superfamily II DNA/RNA helicase)